MSAPQRMTPEQIEAFLAQPINVMVAAIRRDGRPQMSPNWFVWDGARFYISTTRLSGRSDGKQKLMLAYGK